jgi:hypothetical protein
MIDQALSSILGLSLVSFQDLFGIKDFLSSRPGDIPWNGAGAPLQKQRHDEQENGVT